MKYRLVLPILLSAATIAALIAFSRPTSAPTNTSLPAFVPTSSGGAVPPPRHSARNSQNAEPSTPSRPTLPAPAVRAVLPALSFVPSDWRNYNPDHLTVSPSPDATFEFERIAFKPGGPNNEFTVWTGRNPDNPGASLIGVAHDRGWTGTLSLPDATEYRIDVHDDIVSVIPKIRGICEPVVALSEGTQVIDHADLAATGPATAAAEQVHVVDVLFFYGDDVVRRYGETNAQRSVELEAVSQIERANRILEQSEISTLQWRFLAAERVPAYAKPDNMADDLRVFAYSNNPVGQFVQSRVSALGADQAVLYLSDRRNQSPNTAGIANTPGHHSVVLIQADAQTTTHELAHNFGCHHDRRTDSVPDNNGRHHYGHRFTYRNRDSGTVMSYAPYALPYFSNPELQIDSSLVVFGTSEKLTLGVAAGQPRAADNARHLRERAKSMADTRTSADAPRITAQPRSATVIAGQPFSLTVTANGAGLAYQWSKDGAAIPGATSAAYSKSNSETSDAGSYTVTVSNSAGRVVSSAAALAITHPAPSTSASSAPPPSANTGGGGGGGGAPSIWFLAALALLTTLRQLRSHKRERVE